MKERAHRGAIAFVVLGLTVSACGGQGDARVASQLQVANRPQVHEGVVTSARGTPVREGQSCSVEVDGTSHDVWSCRVRVRCGEELVYGLVDAGYNRCREDAGRFVEARDQHGTREDGDPRMRFDLGEGRIVVSDDDPELYVVIGLTRAP